MKPDFYYWLCIFGAGLGFVACLLGIRYPSRFRLGSKWVLIPCSIICGFFVILSALILAEGSKVATLSVYTLIWAGMIPVGIFLFGLRTTRIAWLSHGVVGLLVLVGWLRIVTN